MPDSRVLSEAEQNRYLLEIYSLLHECAPEHAAEDQVDDLVHDLTCDILESLREGTWTFPETTDKAFVHTLLINRVRDRYRSRRRAEGNDAEHLRAREMTHPSWMLPDQARDEEWIAAFEDAVLATLPRRCRQAYCMVRHENASYREAALQLRRSPQTIHNYIVAAHRAFRQALGSLEMFDPLSNAEALAASAARKRNPVRFAPRYPAAAPVTTAR